MALLTDTDIKKIVVTDRKTKHGNDKLLISPYDEKCLTPVGYDLRIGSDYASRKFGKYDTLKENEEINIRSGDTILVKTLERIEMPENLSISGLISSKVSIVTKGLTHISTTVDPDWKGNLLITISNVSNETVTLKYGQAFCTAVFLENKSLPTVLSNHDDSRNDLFFKDWTKVNKKARRVYNRKFALILLLIPLSTYLGWLLFGNAEGMSGFVAAGAALSLYLKDRI